MAYPEPKFSYSQAVDWIALNDEPLDDDVNSNAAFISVGLLADMYGFSTKKVAKDVVRVKLEETEKLKEQFEKQLEKRNGE